MSRQPIVVIVGRPNVGKSTLFNRLTRSRRALVHDLPGVTRDRIVAEARRPGGGVVALVDTGGLLLEDEDHWLPLIRAQAETALRGADAVLFLVDGNAGVIPEDREIAGFLRGLGVPVVVVVNKADRRDAILQAEEFHSIGLGEPVAISAEHGMGMAELWAALEPHLGPEGETSGDDVAAGGLDGCVDVAIVGRPNVGKSSLLNRLVGEARVLVSEVPGTTRDAVDVVVERDGRRFRFVDTAGIRRKGRTDQGPEVLSVMVARRHLEQARLVLVLLEAVEGVTRQDAHVAGYAWEAGRATALVVNKWDLVSDHALGRARLEDQVQQQMKFLHDVPVHFLSALTGRGVNRLFPIMTRLADAHGLRTVTGELNRVLHKAWERQPPPAGGKAAPKLFYATQVGSSPPSFVLFTNLTRPPHFSYQRYLENSLRQAYDLAGIPIRVMIKGRKS